ncbi:PIN domain-containing protein [Thermus sp.]|uniref:PIN domain-containing protein n=1 Tax=Thermus sp. TaxID=275 RepID=UPI00307DB93A
MRTGSRALVIDTSALFAWVNARDPDHAWVRQELETFPGELLFPVPLLAEVAYLLERRMGIGVPLSGRPRGGVLHRLLGPGDPS